MDTVQSNTAEIFAIINHKYIFTTDIVTWMGELVLKFKLYHSEWRIFKKYRKRQKNFGQKKIKSHRIFSRYVDLFPKVFGRERKRRRAGRPFLLLFLVSFFFSFLFLFLFLWMSWRRRGVCIRFLADQYLTRRNSSMSPASCLGKEKWV